MQRTLSNLLVAKGNSTLGARKLNVHETGNKTKSTYTHTHSHMCKYKGFILRKKLCKMQHTNITLTALLHLPRATRHMPPVTCHCQAGAKLKLVEINCINLRVTAMKFNGRCSSRGKCV
ncbi:unnamed protein product [Ceratitis capitata]|uniref:(Mediterranean fruit fly) hypothetical protein n=1 Tax=Ceratitis capitata TaxID=7213 RepID=A0A811UYX8_CERCA|nr:unnamed protein product [Ceratitis capitata]